MAAGVTEFAEDREAEFVPLPEWLRLDAACGLAAGLPFFRRFRCATEKTSLSDCGASCAHTILQCLGYPCLPSLAVGHTWRVKFSRCCRSVLMAARHLGLHSIASIASRSVSNHCGLINLLNK